MMTISRDDAAQALGEIDAARGRTMTLTRYRRSAPHFMLWGLIWMGANTVTEFAPRAANLFWAAATLFGIVGANVIVALQRRERRGAGEAAGRPVRTMGKTVIFFLVIVAFFVAEFTVLGPMGSRMSDAYISLFWAFVYMAVGVWAGWRIFVIGLATAALILVGYFTLTQYYFLWMAVVGGGSLFAGGLWLRRA